MWKEKDGAKTNGKNGGDDDAARGFFRFRVENAEVFPHRENAAASSFFWFSTFFSTRCGKVKLCTKAYIIFPIPRGYIKKIRCKCC